jgi:alpha-1,4-digalacturonate transport system substrate-binding protein
MMTQLTVTGMFVNKTLFEQAGVPLPGENATWEDWAKASKAVATKTQAPFPIAIDRSGHRFAPLAVASGAKSSTPRARRSSTKVQGGGRQVRQLEQGRTDAQGSLGGVGGSQYRDAFDEFANGRVVAYYPAAGRCAGWTRR